jgi:BirA family biotin operon repressor/biotin-[acetyl-CoA-carboxylase] ligase
MFFTVGRIRSFSKRWMNPDMSEDSPLHAPPLVVFDEATSTNDTILDAGERGEPEWTTHLARTQTRGRGRAGHAWWSPRGAGVWMSILLRPRRGREFWGGLALVSGSAVRRALADLGVPGVELFWPNDLQVRGRKIGGILCEVREREGRAWMAVGIGVNVDLSPVTDAVELPAELQTLATSMVECGSPCTTDPVRIAKTFVARLRGPYERFESGEPLETLLEGEIAHSGQAVTVHSAGAPAWRGTVVGLGPHGELRVRPLAPRGGGDDEGVAVTGGTVTYEPA